MSMHKVGDSLVIFFQCDAEYPGGIRALKEFIYENTSMFQLNWEDTCTSKRAYVSFVVEVSGDVTEITIVRGITESLDNEILCLMERMPKWIPACDENATPVRSRNQLPITLSRSD